MGAREEKEWQQRHADWQTGVFCRVDINDIPCSDFSLFMCSYLSWISPNAGESFFKPWQSQTGIKRYADTLSLA